MKIVAILLSLSLLVLIHELGHYFFAKLFKTRVEKFYLFFNPYFSILRMKKVKGKWAFSFFSRKSPESFEKENENTEWGIGWIPLGGYCSVSGMSDGSHTSAKVLDSEVKPWEYRSKPAWQRLMIILGGVIMNFIGAIIIFSFILFFFGKESLPIQNASMGYDYNKVFLKNGFENGDIILSVNAKPITEMNQVVEEFFLDNSSHCTVKRGDKIIKIMLPKDFSTQMNADNSSTFAIPRFPFIIDKFTTGSLAKAKGMMIGDSIVGINGVKTPTFRDFTKEISNYSNKEINLNFFRKGQEYNVLIKLDENAKIGADSRSPYLIYPTKKIEYNFFESIPEGIAQGTNSLIVYVKQFKYLFSKKDTSQLEDVDTIGSLFPSTWNWKMFWNMTAFISIILGIINILPIPTLDGGYAMSTLWEMITKRKSSDR
ncbi:MAG: site-2 protease family protein [Bacteroidales bacterium]|nr:site-2 protease family protein [Bacteroidales bacterium]MDD4704157.1 site-2 protease family protein [Bacteroidales bacterium]